MQKVTPCFWFADQAEEAANFYVSIVKNSRISSFAEATRILGRHIGRPDLEYVQFSEDDMVQALVQAGMSKSFAGLYVEMTRAFREGVVKPSKGRTRENTTPRRFEDFARELAVAYESA